MSRFEESKQKARLGFASPVVGVLVMANTLLGGSGMLGIPHAFAECGWALGLVCIVCFGIFSAFGSHLLACAAIKLGHAPASFYSVSNTVAPQWTWLIDGAVMIKCFGVGTSYLIIVGDLLPDALSNLGVHGMTRREGVLIGFAIAAPLAFLKNLSALRYTAMGSVIIAIWTAILIVFFCLIREGTFEPCNTVDQSLPCEGATYIPVGNGWLDILRALPVFIFGFTCQQNVFTVVNEVHDTTKARVNMIIAPAYLISAVLFGGAAFAGYMTYGNLVANDVLSSYPRVPIVTVSRLLFAILVMFSYPMQAHPSRLSALALMHKFYPARANEGGVNGGTAAAATAKVRFWVITALWVSLSLTIALVVSDLSTILGIVGATGSTTVTYILPGLLYIRSHRHRHWKRRFAMLQLFAGCIIMPLCLTVLFV